MHPFVSDQFLIRGFAISEVPKDELVTARAQAFTNDAFTINVNTYPIINSFAARANNQTSKILHPAHFCCFLFSSFCSEIFLLSCYGRNVMLYNADVMTCKPVTPALLRKSRFAV